MLRGYVCTGVAALVSLAMGLPAPGAVIDPSLAAGGGRGHFSSRLGHGAVPWELFTQSMAATAPTGNVTMFSEPGMGNAVGEARGQVLMYRPIDGQYSRIVVDVLAWVPVPQVFYVDIVPIQAEPQRSTATSGFIPTRINSPSGFFTQPRDNTPTVIVIPEPASLALLIAPAAAVALRRRRQ